MDPSYTPPSLEQNDRTVGLLIEAPQEEARPRVAYRYIDPGATAGLASLAPGATWSVKLNGVQPLSTLFVNWAFSFGAGEAPDLEIRALDSEGDEVADSIEPEVSGAPATLIARLDSGDTFTVVFENEDDDSPILSRGFSVRERVPHNRRRRGPGASSLRETNTRAWLHQSSA